jgi:hypothetical protein
MDELEWRRIDAAMTDEEREAAVEDFIELVVAVDGILQQQANFDAEYFLSICGRDLSEDQGSTVARCLLRAYRWQYILSGAQHPHFNEVLSGMISEAQGARIGSAIAALS